MTIEQVIARLQELKTQHGNLEVRRFDDEYSAYSEINPEDCVFVQDKFVQIAHSTDVWRPFGTKEEFCGNFMKFISI